jgi:CubicO group peptidase (beta-lactamase class C family)
MFLKTRALMMFVAVSLVEAANAQVPWPTERWARAEPSAVGLDVKVLDRLNEEIAAGKHGYIDSMLIIRHGKVAYERFYKHDYDRIYAAEAKRTSPLNAHDPSGPYNYFNPWWHPYYRGGDLHTMQSVTKTVTSVVIGVAAARKEFPDLETPVLRYFDASKVKRLDARKERMTIRHLLTMTAGLDWNENLPYLDPNNTTCAMEASFDWVTFTIDRPMANEPGEVFRYNSGATQLLAYIFRRATGRDIEEYAAQHLFAPLGINRFHWKRSPTGLIDTEGGLYLRPADLAKIAYLFLHNGVWEDKTIVAPEWVKASITPSVTVSPEGVKYGFKWWIYSYGKERNHWAWGGSGFGGQRPIVVPHDDLVMVFTAWDILPGRPSLTSRAAIERVLQAVIDQPSPAAPSR